VLSQQEADDFRAAAKVVPESDGPLVWRKSSKNVVVCDVGVEIDAVEVGTLLMVADLEVDRHWSFGLLRERQEVYRIDVRPIGRTPSHGNPCNCPADFPRKVRAHVHEHIYVEGLGVECAKAIECDLPALHSTALALFCENARICFMRAYPSLPEVQIRMDYT
jgi:hypothetical protein